MVIITEKEDKISLKYAAIPLITIFVGQYVVYFMTKFINAGMDKHNFTFPVDELIPFVPESSYIYLGCYLFWLYSFFLIAKTGKKNFYNMLSSIYLSYPVCFAFFVLLPTTIERPVLSGNMPSEYLMRFIYNADTPVNLFPSMHCLLSWYCYMFVRKRNDIKKGYRIFSLIFTILICISTQTTKQHYLIDIFGGILLAELSWYIAEKINFGKKLAVFFDRINTKLNVTK